MKLSFSQIVFVLFTAFWAGLLFIDYLDKHPVYFLSITHYKYTGLTTFWLIAGVFISLWYGKFKWFKRNQRPFINGIMIYVLFLIIICTICYTFNIYFQADLNLSNYIHLITRSSYTLFCSFLVMLSAYSLGFISLKKVLTNQVSGLTRWLTECAIGFFLLSMVLFALASIGLLSQWPVLCTLLLFPLAVYKHSFNFIKKILWTRIDIPQQWNVWGIGILYLTLIFSSINFLYTQAPFPLGFDARNYYVNLSQLLADKEALISGFQPYAWSLIDSVGYTAFHSSEVTLFLATIGGFLACVGLYNLGSKYLQLDQNYALLTVLFFMLTPAINNHWIVEFKVDLGLLFIQMTILCLLLHWLAVTKVEGERLLKDKDDWVMLSIISILMGFCMSIKVLSIFLTFGVYLSLWLYNKDRWGLLATVCLSFAIVLFLKLDNISGLRSYHSDPKLLQLALLISAIILFILSFARDKRRILHTIGAISVSIIIMILSFSPWMVKNYFNQGDRSFSILPIVMGSTPRIKTNVNQIMRTYEDKLKKEDLVQ